MRLLIIGSGPDAPRTVDWDLSVFSAVLVINNAWRANPNWTHLVCPDDFPMDRRPSELSGSQKIIGSDDYIPALNRYGGIVFCGGTMAFNAPYWALERLKPTAMYFIGCDMVYAGKDKTHFYGKGTADPLRKDPTLQSLKAKSTRLEALMAMKNCTLFNLSSGDSELTFRRAAIERVPDLVEQPRHFDQTAVQACLTAERDLKYHFPDGRYWKDLSKIDWSATRAIDDAWLHVPIAAK